MQRNPKNHRIANAPGLRTKSAAFGATLYCDLVLFGATKCDVDNRSNSFNLLLLFGSVQGSARWCFKGQNRT
jgi:hypothetical protein